MSVWNEVDELLGLDYLGGKLLKGKSRKVAECKRCRTVIPKGATSWRPIVENGPRLIRPDRVCDPCVQRLGDREREELP